MDGQNLPENLEESLVKLERITQELESKKLGLNESLSKYEQGIILYKNCKKFLDEAEKKIKILTEDLQEIDLENKNVEN